MTVYQHISKNKRKTTFLITLFIAIIAAIGYFFGEYYGTGGYSGLFYAGILSIVMALIGYFSGDKIALAAAGAKQIEKADNPYLFNMVENLAITAGIPTPKIYIIPDNAMNAFATGRNYENASIAFTVGIINGLENEELEAVAAHELSHVQNYDMRVMMIVAVLVGVIALLADWMFRMSFFGSSNREKKDSRIEAIFAIVGLVLILLSPLIAELIKLSVSRKREYLADASAVLMTRYADGLINALRKIAAQEQQESNELIRANKATAHLYFANPFKRGKFFSRAFSTHPPIEERIAALQQMGGQAEAQTK